jgi:hypothetical protein
MAGLGSFVKRAKNAKSIVSATEKAAPHLEGAFMRLGKMGRSEGLREAEIIARGKRRAYIGGGAVAGMGLIGHTRRVGASSGASGMTPGSSGGYA